MNYEKIRDEILNFRDQRDWKQFHNPKDLAIAISIEAGVYCIIQIRVNRETP